MIFVKTSRSSQYSTEIFHIFLLNIAISQSVSIQFILLAPTARFRCKPPTTERIRQSTYINPEDGGRTFLRNICNGLQDNTVAQPKRQQYGQSPLWICQNIQKYATLNQKKKAYRVLVGKSEVKRPLVISIRRWEYNIKMEVTVIEWGGTNWIHLSQDTLLPDNGSRTSFWNAFLYPELWMDV
jgi:hypothetical protein